MWRTSACVRHADVQVDVGGVELFERVLKVGHRLVVWKEGKKERRKEGKRGKEKKRKREKKEEKEKGRKKRRKGGSVEETVVIWEADKRRKRGRDAQQCTAGSAAEKGRACVECSWGCTKHCGRDVAGLGYTRAAAGVVFIAWRKHRRILLCRGAKGEEGGIALTPHVPAQGG